MVVLTVAQVKLFAVIDARWERHTWSQLSCLILFLFIFLLVYVFMPTTMPDERDTPDQIFGKM